MTARDPALDALYRQMLLGEARASVALDRDSDVQTITIPEPEVGDDAQP